MDKSETSEKVIVAYQTEKPSDQSETKGAEDVASKIPLPDLNASFEDNKVLSVSNKKPKITPSEATENDTEEETPSHENQVLCEPPPNFIYCYYYYCCYFFGSF